MAKKKEEVQGVEIDAIARPTAEVMETLLPEISGYIVHIESQIDNLIAELNEKPGAQARGIVWVDLFGYARNDVGARFSVKVNLTQRSDVDSFHAFEQCLSALKRIKGEYHMQPYVEDLQYKPVKGGNGQEAPTPEAEEAPTEERKRRRKREPAEADEQTPSKTNEAIGSEKWYPVKSMKVVLSEDESQKYIYAKMGKWTKYGKPAYLDSSGVPEDVVTMIETDGWVVGDASVSGVELKEDFPEMQFALLSADEKMIVQFASKIP